MDKISSLIKQVFEQQALTEAILSNVKKNDPSSFTKVVIKPVDLKGVLHYQFSQYYGKKVLHENHTVEEAEKNITKLLDDHFKQAMIHTTSADYHVLISKKGKVTILNKKPTKTEVRLSHNRKKNYLIEEGTVVPFLIELGVMNSEGKVLAKKYDKFKQINRFLEMIDDIVPHLPKNRTIHIVDFGCGKSYLTFAMYYFLKEIRSLDIHVIGLDLKADVIQHCSHLAGEFGYKELTFLEGDITQYTGLQEVDMVVTLHACDTATDAALEKAVRWGASVILSVPCCQHELFNQMNNSIMTPMLSHGIVKERFAALATDSVRAQILSIVGYKTQLLEFIDMEHTPKNILIRAVKSDIINREDSLKEYLQFKNFLQIDPYLGRALADYLQ